MMAMGPRKEYSVLLLVVGLVGWLVPGGGYFILKERKRAIIVFVTIVLTFLTGLYIGSIGVIDYYQAKLWYVGQIMVSPAVAILERITAGGGYPVYGRPQEIGQVYTSIAGLLNLMCVINAVYLAYVRQMGQSGGQDVA